MTKEQEIESGEYSINFKLSPESEQILHLAAEEVDKTQGITYIRPEILLVTTLTSPEVTNILSQQGIEKTKVQENLRDLIKSTPKEIDPANKIEDPTTRITNSTREALFQARNTAMTNDRLTSPADIFTGICIVGHSYATDVLAQSGFNVEIFLNTIKSESPINK